MSTAYVGEASLDLSKGTSHMGGKWMLSITEQPESPECCLLFSSAELRRLIDWMQGCVAETVNEDEQEDDEEEGSYEDGYRDGYDEGYQSGYDDGVDATDDDESEARQ